MEINLKILEVVKIIITITITLIKIIIQPRKIPIKLLLNIQMSLKILKMKVSFKINKKIVLKWVGKSLFRPFKTKNNNKFKFNINPNSVLKILMIQEELNTLINPNILNHLSRLWKLILKFVGKNIVTLKKSLKKL